METERASDGVVWTLPFDTMSEEDLKKQYLEWLHKGRELYDRIGNIITKLGDSQNMWEKYERSWGWAEYVLMRGPEGEGLFAKILYCTPMIGEKTGEPMVNRSIAICIGQKWVMWLYHNGLPVSAAMYGNRTEVFLDGPWVDAFLELEEEIDPNIEDAAELAIKRKERMHMIGLLRDGIVAPTKWDRDNAKVLPGK